VGEDVDVVEIDAASNTGVDNIRELRSNATLRPTRARFKIYIIDEVHMLSTGAFNALLKTLEEPPTHVKFILATTEAQKVPATIQSRCQRFDFRAIDSAAIAKHLEKILASEKIQADESVVRRIARLANGSMRDALSLLEKLLSYESEHLTAAIVDDIIPPPHDELAAAVIDCVAEGDSAGALGALDRALQSGRTVDRFCDHLIEHVRTLMLMRVCGEDTELVDVAGAMKPILSTQAARFDAPTYVYMISLLEELRRHVKFSGAARALADAAVVRLAMSHQFTDINDLIERLEGDGETLLSTGGTRDIKKNDTPSGTQPQQPTTVTREPQVSSTDRAAHRLHGERKKSAKPRLAPQPTRLTSDQCRRVEQDPFVQRIKDAVDGTSLNVRPVVQPKQAKAGTEKPVNDDNVEQSLIAAE
jgi:DNA polymerase-3 subunit gamma/tau